MKMFTTCSEWVKSQVKLVVYIVNLVRDSNILVKPIAKFVCKIVKLSLHLDVNSSYQGVFRGARGNFIVHE